jgi:hypothetical protein
MSEDRGWDTFEMVVFFDPPPTDVERDAFATAMHEAAVAFCSCCGRRRRRWWTPWRVRTSCSIPCVSSSWRVDEDLAA